MAAFIVTFILLNQIFNPSSWSLCDQEHFGKGYAIEKCINLFIVDFKIQ